MMTREESLQLYIEQTLDIRTLSSPQVQDIQDAEDYRIALIDGFTKIGSIGKDNNEILRTHWIPLIRSEEALKDEEKDTLSAFSQSLLDAYQMENLDLPMRYRQTKRLLQDARLQKDDDIKICALDSMVEASFAMMHMAQRLIPCNDSCYEYRDEGLRAAEELLSYLEPEKFSRLKNRNSKQLVLINARYISALFDRSDHYCDEINSYDFEMMRRALSMDEDAFLLSEAPEYNWKYHRFRTLQYITNFTELNNVRGFSQKELQEIYEDTLQLAALWESDREYFGEYCTREMIDMYLARASFLAGHMDEEEYKHKLSSLVHNGDGSLFTLHGNLIQALALNEYMLLIQGKELTEEDCENLRTFYHNLVQYVHKMPKKGSFSFLLTFLSDFLKSYIEVPGAPGFEEMCLLFMVAIHPPTYVHSLMVADFAKCITKHLIHKKPVLFIGVLDCLNVVDVQRKEEEILDFVYHAGLCHDVGKLFVTETILNYGRSLFPEEFDMIRAHPSIGSYVLADHKDTAAYANIALLHHQWYDGTAGYPLEPNGVILPEKIMIDIIAGADCLDASTDVVGRSYKNGIMLDDYLRELRVSSGTRYAPFLADLLEMPEVYKDIKTVLTKGRDNNYRKAYEILRKNVTEE